MTLPVFSTFIKIDDYSNAEVIYYFRDRIYSCQHGPIKPEVEIVDILFQRDSILDTFGASSIKQISETLLAHKLGG